MRDVTLAYLSFEEATGFAPLTIQGRHEPRELCSVLKIRSSWQRHSPNEKAKADHNLSRFAQLAQVGEKTNTISKRDNVVRRSIAGASHHPSRELIQ
jgi:hypothetical protein